MKLSRYYLTIALIGLLILGFYFFEITLRVWGIPTGLILFIGGTIAYFRLKTEEDKG